jgi:hypothetical protein
MIKCVGLVTHGNELDRGEGSLKQCNNMNVDEDGVITPRRGFNDYAGPTGGSESDANITKQILEYKDSLIRHYSDKMEYEDANGSFLSINGAYNELRTGYRIKSQESNSNMYFTTDEGIKKMSVASQADLNADMITDAGGIKAGYASGVIVPTIGGFLPPQSKVAYRVVFGTKDANNNLILGSPSSRFVVTNFSADQNTEEETLITITGQTSPASDPIKDGDYFTYTNDSGKYTVYFDTTGSYDTEPKTSETIGSSYVRITVNGLTTDEEYAAVIANIIAGGIPGIDVSVATNIVTITDQAEGNIGGITASREKDGTTPAESRIDTETPTDGATSVGDSGNVRIKGIVPEGATTDYFYQIYRTGYLQVSTGLTINDIDPGDEMNLVYESGLTENGVDGEIDLGEFEFVDSTPDSFRASSVPLYTNAITGEGILQSNEVPPIALDMALFRSSMFYANTKSKHQLEFDVISVDNFISGSTRIIIGNDEVTRYYTFVGSAEVTDVTITGTPADGDYINLSSANDERQYYIWFDAVGDSSGDPEVTGASAYRINVSDAPSNDEIANRIDTALLDNIDFSLSVASNVITFTHTNNGYTDGITAGVSLTNVTIGIPSVDGTGELANTDEGGDVLLSGLVSVGQSIDETARSLAKIISQDQQSPVNAYYLSTSDDLPGQLFLENRSLEDRAFYIAIDEPTDTAIGGEFSPELPYSVEIEELTVTTTDRTITITNHGYSTNDKKFISFFDDPGSPSSLNSFSGVYTITVTGVDTFTIDEGDLAVGTVVTPAFSGVFNTDVESDNQVSPNRLYYSKVSEPEAVPITNYIDVGPKDEEIKRILALRDNLFVLKDDGVYIVSGTSAPNFSVRLLDNTKIIAPDSAVVLNNQIYALTQQGIAVITDSGVGIISRKIENLIDEITNKRFDFASNTFGIAYENDRAYIMFAPTDSTDDSATQAFRYNIFERTWTRWEYEATCGKVKESDNRLYIGNGDRNYISQERKDNSRTDHSDRNFPAAINTNGVSGKIVELSSLLDVEVNDVIVQQQDVTINYLNNRLLLKMDTFDSGITPPLGSTMYDSFKASTGDDMPTKLQALNNYMVSIDPVNITAKVFTSTTVRAKTEELVDELNLAATITSIKTYKKPTTVYYESYIDKKDTLRNQVTVHSERPWIEGAIEVYKHFTKTTEWNPQHFGDPSALKQIRYVTIIFDQNNFYDATAKFASDAAQAVKEVNFQGKGIGYWDDMPWADPNHYWGGVGNDIPFRNPVPRGKQKCRYLSMTFEHKNAREYFKILGITGVVRPISDRAYK